MKRLDCKLYGIIMSLRYLQPISGHDFEEVYDNSDLQVLRCVYCGEESIGWKKEKYAKTYKRY